MKFAWLTDIHLDYVRDNVITKFFHSLSKKSLDAILFSGDIAIAETLRERLIRMAESAQCTVYFVLGNHDFYGSSTRLVRQEMLELTRENENVVWLPSSDGIRLSDDIALIGHDSWPDGRYGDYKNSEVMLTDYFAIDEFRGLNKDERLLKLQELAEDAANHFRKSLEWSLDWAKTIIALTHIPPYRETSLYDGKISGDEYLPHFTCKIVGDIFLKAMENHDNKSLKIFCGHTHAAAQIKIRDNIEVTVGEAEYGKPTIQQMIEM